jgi:hypothetical protein
MMQTNGHVCQANLRVFFRIGEGLRIIKIRMRNAKEKRRTAA